MTYEKIVINFIAMKPTKHKCLYRLTSLIAFVDRHIKLGEIICKVPKA